MATEKGNQGRKGQRGQSTKTAGRLPVEYTPEQLDEIDQLAFEGHKTGTIAVALGVDHKTLEEHCSQRMKKKRVEGKIALKRVQIEKALKGDTGMLVWLGKNMLEQTDKRETTHNVSKELSTVLGLINGGTKGMLPNDDASDSSEAPK